MAMTAELRDFYLKQENGRRLLAGVKIIPNPATDSEEDVEETEEAEEDVEEEGLQAGLTHVLEGEDEAEEVEKVENKEPTREKKVMLLEGLRACPSRLLPACLSFCSGVVS